MALVADTALNHHSLTHSLTFNFMYILVYELMESCVKFMLKCANMHFLTVRDNLKANTNVCIFFITLPIEIQDGVQDGYPDKKSM